MQSLPDVDHVSDPEASQTLLDTYKTAQVKMVALLKLSHDKIPSIENGSPGWCEYGYAKLKELTEVSCAVRGSRGSRELCNCDFMDICRILRKFWLLFLQYVVLFHVCGRLIFPSRSNTVKQCMVSIRVSMTFIMIL